MRFQTPDPSTTRNMMARRMNGNASWISARRMIRSSTHPPKYPERRPATTPMLPPTAMAAIPTNSETRAP